MTMTYLEAVNQARQALSVTAADLRNCHTVGGAGDWTGEPEAKAEHDRLLLISKALANPPILLPDEFADVEALEGVREWLATQPQTIRVLQRGGLGFEVVPAPAGWLLSMVDALMTAARLSPGASAHAAHRMIPGVGFGCSMAPVSPDHMPTLHVGPFKVNKQSLKGGQLDPAPRSAKKGGRNG